MTAISMLVMEDLGTSFIRQLSDSDAESLTVEFARTAFGDDAEALEAAEREVLALLDAEAQCFTSAPGRTP